MVLSQGRKKNIEQIRRNLSKTDVKLLAGVWDEPCDASVDLQRTTWGEGRNIIFTRANQLYPDYYWLWMDDDSEFEKGTLELFIRECLITTHNRSDNLIVPITDKVRNSLYTKLNKNIYSTKTLIFDEQIMFYPPGPHRQSITNHDLTFQQDSWFSVAEINENCILSTGYTVIQLNQFAVLNKTHATDSCSSSNYVRSSDKKLKNIMHMYFNKNNSTHWSRVHFRIKNYYLHKIVLKLIMLINVFYGRII